MSNFRALITNFSPGSAKQVEFIVDSPPAGVLCDGAQFVVKSNPDDDDASPVLEKTITTSDVSGTGQILDDGTSGTWTVRVDLTAADTVAIGMNRMRFYLLLSLDAFPDPYIPFVGTVAAAAKSVVLA